MIRMDDGLVPNGTSIPIALPFKTPSQRGIGGTRGRAAALPIATLPSSTEAHGTGCLWMHRRSPYVHLHRSVSSVW